MKIFQLRTFNEDDAREDYMYHSASPGLLFYSFEAAEKYARDEYNELTQNHSEEGETYTKFEMVKDGANKDDGVTNPHYVFQNNERGMCYFIFEAEVTA